MLRSLLVVLGVVGLAGCAANLDEGRPLTDAESVTTAGVGACSFEVCELVGRDAIVKVLAGNEGTRYTLCTLEGSTIAADISAAELRRIRPDLDPESMQADWGRGGLMMVDFRE